MLARFLAPVSAIVLGPLAAADEIIYSVVQAPLTPPAQNLPLTFPPFDPALGQLQFGLLRIDATIEGQAAYENLSPFPFTAQVSISANTLFVAPGGVQVQISGIGLQFSDDLAGFDGTLDFSGSSGTTHPILESESAQVVLSAAALQGSAWPIVLLSAADATSTNLGSSAAFQASLTVQASLTLTYVYLNDCNGDGVDDKQQVCAGVLADVDDDGIPDVCQHPPNDCNGNGIPDAADILGPSDDCNANGIPDECEPDCNGNGIADPCDISMGTSADANADGVPDDCPFDDDCDDDGTPNACEADVNHNGVADSCEVGFDCNGNGLPDEFEIFQSPALDANGDGTLDCCAQGSCLQACACTAELSCPNPPNSTGLPGRIGFGGSCRVSDGHFVLTASDGPAGKSGFFLYGTQAALVPFGLGTRCVGGQVFRLPAQTLDAQGHAQRELDLAPAGLPAAHVLPGSVWHFQFCHRDVGGGATVFNLTDALTIGFCP